MLVNDSEGLDKIVGFCANKNTIRCVALNYHQFGSDSELENFLKVLRETQSESLYAIEFRYTNIDNSRLKIIFEQTQYYKILHNIMVVSDGSYDEVAINTCRNYVIKNGPFCAVVYDKSKKYNMDGLWSRGI